MAALWRDRECLAPVLAVWRERVKGRPLFRTATGEGWVSLSLHGDDHAALFLAALPGAATAFPYDAPLPGALRDDLRPTRGGPLRDVLREGVLLDVGLLADDLALEVVVGTDHGPRRVRCQLFGQRGGITVLDSTGRMLWTAHPSPHPCLVDPQATCMPPADPWGDTLSWTTAGLGRLARQRETALADRLQRVLGRRQATAARLTVNLAADLERADGGAQRRREAEALAANLHAMARGQDSVTVTDPRDGAPLTIALDPSLPPPGNVERLFRLARKAERGHEVIAERLAEAQAEQQRVAEAVARLAPLAAGPDPEGAPTLEASLERLAALREFAAEYPDLTTPPVGPDGRAPDQPARPFRRYRIDGKWDVWVGRSREENDELTHRASHPRDLWLHAQGVSGSHVILRTGGRPDTVPRPALEKAAALAALHSKAKHSSLVPVIWTEQRYVRRPRKSPPGTAVCLREDNLFIEPGVMPGVEPA